jgi:transcription termination factor Rho
MRFPSDSNLPNHKKRTQKRSDSPQRKQQQRPHRPHAAHQRRDQHPAELSFLRKTVIDPAPRIFLESGLKEKTVRAMDLICPIGRGQRGLIVAPPGSGKTTYLKHIAAAIHGAAPEIKLYCMLIDERPEEVTDFKRSVPAEVFSSSCDQDYSHHINTANELMKRAFIEADAGADVFLLIDSLTRLSRVHNAGQRGNGRTMSGGLDADALRVPRKIFGSARNIEGKGSIGILATILIETGSRMDDIIFEEFKGTGNMEIVLSREVSNRRIFPAIKISASGTRREEYLLTEAEKEPLRILRSGVAGMNDVEAAELLIKMLEKHPTNEELLKSIMSGKASK